MEEYDQSRIVYGISIITGETQQALRVRILLSALLSSEMRMLLSCRYGKGTPPHEDLMTCFKGMSRGGQSERPLLFPQSPYAKS